MPEPLIAVFGANPAWQKTLYFSDFTPGKVNRAERMEAYAGGKGANFCRAAGCRGICRTRLFQFAGGVTGTLHEVALRQQKIDFRTVRTVAETRCCTTCLDRSHAIMTELIEPSSAVSAAESEAMRQEFESTLAEASGAAITGSLPDGTDPGLYYDLAILIKKYQIPLMIDAVSGIAPTLDAVETFLLKINMSELKQLTGATAAEQALEQGMQRWPMATLAITDGAEDAWMATAGKMYRFILPPLEIVSPLGAGDCCAAVFMSEWLNGKSETESFACGLAAAGANCLTPRAGEFDNSECAALYPEIVPLFKRKRRS